MKAKLRPEERLSNAFAEVMVAPMTCFRARLASGRAVLIGERWGVFLWKGEFEGVSLMLPPQAGLMIRGLDGVSDMKSSREAGESGLDQRQTCQLVVVFRRHASCACQWIPSWCGDGRNAIAGPFSRVCTLVTVLDRN